MLSSRRLFYSLAFLMAPLAALAQQPDVVIAPGALLRSAASNLDATGSSQKVVSVTHPKFAQVVEVVIGRSSKETNATQITLPNVSEVKKSDVLIASVWFRGHKTGRQEGAEVGFLFERSTSPWTKSMTVVRQSNPDGKTWTQANVAFAAAEDYRPGEAMFSIRLAFGPQTVDIGGLTVKNLHRTIDLDAARDQALADLHDVDLRITVYPKQVRQTMLGLGGNFCQPRYGSKEPIDGIGRRILKDGQVTFARVGLPLNYWTPRPGVYDRTGPAGAALAALKQLSARKIPIVISVWEGPTWMVGGAPEQSGKVLDAGKYEACIDAIAAYLSAAKAQGSRIDYLSFNEPDYGVNFKFSPSEMVAFIGKAGPRLRRLGLTTKFIVGDTANGADLVDFARPILQDASISSYLGPIGFHCWDVLSASDATYRAIAALGHEFHKSVLCLEAGHDAQLWQQDNPWDSWENGLRLAQAYAKTVRLTGAQTLLYWTYENNYPLMSLTGRDNFFRSYLQIVHFEELFATGRKVVEVSPSVTEVECVATIGAAKNDIKMLIVNPGPEAWFRVSGLPADWAFDRFCDTSARRSIDWHFSSPAGVATILAPPRSVTYFSAKKPLRTWNDRHPSWEGLGQNPDLLFLRKGRQAHKSELKRARRSR